MATRNASSGIGTSGYSGSLGGGVMTVIAKKMMDARSGDVAWCVCTVSEKMTLSVIGKGLGMGLGAGNGWSISIGSPEEDERWK